MATGSPFQYSPFLGLGRPLKAMPSKVRAARRVEYAFVFVASVVVLFALMTLAPYWAFRFLVVFLGFYAALCAALINGMKPVSGELHSRAWRVLAYAGIAVALAAAIYAPSRSRQEILFWRYAWTQPHELADLMFDFNAAPVKFNEPEAKQIFPGQPIRCMQFFPEEQQAAFGTHECYFWTNSFNRLPARMSDFVFANDKLTAVRVEVPYWRNSAHHRALVEKYGVPLKGNATMLNTLANSVGPLPKMVAALSTPSLSTWLLRSGVLVMDENNSLIQPTGLVLWMSKEFFCREPRKGRPASSETMRYCSAHQ